MPVVEPKYSITSELARPTDPREVGASWRNVLENFVQPTESYRGTDIKFDFPALLKAIGLTLGLGGPGLDVQPLAITKAQAIKNLVSPKMSEFIKPEILRSNPAAQKELEEAVQLINRLPEKLLDPIQKFGWAGPKDSLRRDWKNPIPFGVNKNLTARMEYTQPAMTLLPLRSAEHDAMTLSEAIAHEVPGHWGNFQTLMDLIKRQPRISPQRINANWLNDMLQSPYWGKMPENQRMTGARALSQYLEGIPEDLNEALADLVAKEVLPSFNTNTLASRYGANAQGILNDLLQMPPYSNTAKQVLSSELLNEILSSLGPAKSGSYRLAPDIRDLMRSEISKVIRSGQRGHVGSRIGGGRITTEPTSIITNTGEIRPTEFLPTGERVWDFTPVDWKLSDAVAKPNTPTPQPKSPSKKPVSGLSKLPEPDLFIHGVDDPREALTILKSGGLKPRTSISKTKDWEYPVRIYLDHPKPVGTSDYHPDHYFSRSPGKIKRIEIDADEFRDVQKEIEAAEKQGVGIVEKLEELGITDPNDPKFYKDPEFSRWSQKMDRLYDDLDRIKEYAVSKGWPDYNTGIDQLKEEAKKLGISVKIKGKK